MTKEEEERYEFIKSIKTVEEFFCVKEPDFHDHILRETESIMRDMGRSDDVILSVLKSSERRRLTEELPLRAPGKAN